MKDLSFEILKFSSLEPKYLLFITKDSLIHTKGSLFDHKDYFM